jgi:hypothetical protein
MLTHYKSFVPWTIGGCEHLRLLTVVLLVLCSTFSLKAESTLDALYTKCTAFIQSFDPTELKQKKLLQVFLERAEQRAKDNQSDTAKELDSILVDYLWDNMKKLEEQDKSCIFTICVYFRFYVDKNLPLPTIVITSLTASKIEKLVTWIDQQLASK